MQKFSYYSPIYLALLPWFFYLATLSPTIYIDDSPEFVDTSFTLGISHPAGFPFYSLVVKAFTYHPFANIAIKVNLFSMIVAVLALAFIFLLARKLIYQNFPNSDIKNRNIAAIIPSGLLAFSSPYWLNAINAEVYSLHALFVCLIIYLLLIWREKGDLRFLFATALVFGLGSGNHATIAFLLPTLLILYFAWNKESILRNLSTSIVFFLVGLSVYSYLPIRSMTEPSYDLGNPETLNGFLYQVMDRKHAHLHFSALKIKQGAKETEINSKPLIGSINQSIMQPWNKIKMVIKGFFQDINQYLSPLLSLGFVVGGVLCLRKNTALLVSLLVLVAINISFFHGWGKESFFASYIVVCIFSSLAIYLLMENYHPLVKRVVGFPPFSSSKLFLKLSNIDWRTIIIISLVSLIPFKTLQIYYQADRSNNYFGDTIFKQLFLSIDNRSLFVTGVSWFHYYYYNDVLRLRDDVTQINAWDLLNENPFQHITARRYPSLNLPDLSKHQFDSKEISNRYIEDLFEKNYNERPIVVEQNQTFFSQFPLTGRFEPTKNIHLKYFGAKVKPFETNTKLNEFNEFSELIEREMQKPGFQNQKRWIEPIAFYINSFAKYYHDRQRYDDERKVLQVIHDFLDSRGPSWHLRMIKNLVLDQKHDEALSLLKNLKEKFPRSYETHVSEGILLRSSGKQEEAVKAFIRASKLDSESYFPHFQLALIYQNQGKLNEAKIQSNLATGKIKTIRELLLIRKGLLSS